jgi:hypothetical protein
MDKFYKQIKRTWLEENAWQKSTKKSNIPINLTSAYIKETLSK